MTARFVLLMVAAVGLSACESTKAVDTSTPAQPVAVQAPAPSVEGRVVRSPIVPDDDVVVADATPTPKKRVVRESAPVADPDPVDVAEPASPVSKPEKPAKPDKAETADAKDAKSEPAPITTADASAPPPASPSDGAPTPTDTAPDTAAPTTDATPAADGTAPKSMFSDPSAFMQAQIGGFPVWLIALVGIVLLLALVVALGGRKKSEEVV